jgi:pyruvate,water dikinase
MALIHFTETDEAVQRKITELTRGYEDKPEYFIERLAHGVVRITASRWPDPVIVRMSDFKTNEYARLVGGEAYEPAEENPMIGWRGASRYYSDGYRDGFALECRAIRRVREDMGLRNVIVMIPFCRTVDEADQVLQVMNENGLARGRDGLQVYVMAEIPSNIILAELFAERNPAVTRSIQHLITTAHAQHRKVGLCGQRPSDDADFAGILVRAGIDSISVTPDSFLAVKQNVAAAEHEHAEP